MNRALDFQSKDLWLKSHGGNRQKNLIAITSITTPLLRALLTHLGDQDVGVLYQKETFGSVICRLNSQV